MKRVFIAIQWIVVAFLLISLVVFIFRTDPPPDYSPKSWKSWTGFYALAVQGVVDSDDPRYLTPAKLDEYLRALREAGFKAITPDDVEAYYYWDTPLPEKAVLLMFEGGRKDHIVRATPRLIQNGLIGTLFVPTSVTRRWGNHFVTQSNLRRISRSANWRLASMGHEAINMITTSGEGKKGHFLSSRLWTRQGRESDVSFQERVFRDYEKAAQILRRAGSRAVAYLYPYGDSGDGKDADPLAASINQGAVRQYHPLAFTQEGRPLNEFSSDPHALSRLRLRGDWSGEELVAMLEDWSSDNRPVSGFENPHRWRFKGDAHVAHESLMLNNKASATLQGSGSWRNLELNAVLNVPANAMGIIYIRYSGPHSYLRITVQEHDVQVQEKRAGKLRTLDRLPLHKKGLREHQVSLTIKGNRLWVEHNGVMFARATPLSRKTIAGHVWLEASPGPMTCSSFDARPTPSLYMIGANYHGMSVKEKSRATALLPYWFNADKVQRLTENDLSGVMLAAQDGLVTMPVITAGDRLGLSEARALASSIAELLNSLTVRMLLREFVITGYQPEVHQAFKAMGLRVSYLVDVVDAETLLAEEIRLTRYERIIVFGKKQRVLNFSKRYKGVLPPGCLVVVADENAELPTGVERAVDMEVQ